MRALRRARPAISGESSDEGKTKKGQPQAPPTTGRYEPRREPSAGTDAGGRFAGFSPRRAAFDADEECAVAGAEKVNHLVTRSGRHLP